VSKTIWHNANSFKINELPKNARYWLQERTSLTQRLRAHCGTSFQVEVLKQNWQHPLPTEARLLNVPLRQYVRVRQVYLHCHQQPWVFAQTVIPQCTLTGAYRRLMRLGTYPLGAVLFAHHLLQRSDLQFAKIQPGEVLYTLATAKLKYAPPLLWGRRSIFYLTEKKPLLVCEVFLFL
jgi:chorismate--pyruvate lyase